MANTPSRRTTASAASTMIAKIVQAARAVRPGREAGGAGTVRMVLTGRRTPGVATEDAPAGGLVGECRRTVWVGCTLDSAPGIGAALFEGLRSMRGFAGRGCSSLADGVPFSIAARDPSRVKEAFTFSMFLRSASIDG